jgi:hypothetical protein
LSPSNLLAAAPTISPNKARAHAHKCIAPFEPRMGRRVVATGAASSGNAQPAQPVVSFAEKIPPRQGRRSHSNAPKKPPKTRSAPTRARRASCNRPKRSDSPYVTFDLAGLAREQCACLYPCIFPRRVQFLMMFPQHHSGVSGG